MIERFQGEEGRRRLIAALMQQKIVAKNSELAKELVDHIELQEHAPGALLIEQSGSDNDIYLIISGKVEIVVNGRSVGQRTNGDHVGEMAAVVPTQRRSASVVAVENSLVAKLPEPIFSDLGRRYPEIFLFIAQELSARLAQRNALVQPLRPKTKVFIVSSAEALPIAREIQNAFQYDAFLTQVWTDGVFKVAHYPLESLEKAIDDSDFAVAVAHADDLTESRGKDWPSPRDNVIFELGMFMGRLGRKRAILMEPREAKVKLPSDMAGLTTVSYRYEQGGDATALLAPACNELRTYIIELGAR